MPVMAVNNQNQHEQPGDYRARPRWSAGKKLEAVLRLLRGRPLETLSRALGVGGKKVGGGGGLSAWRAARDAVAGAWGRGAPVGGLAGRLPGKWQARSQGRAAGPIPRCSGVGGGA